MVYKISDIRKQKDIVENKLQLYKKEYSKPKMTDEQLNALKEKMEEAKMNGKKESGKWKKVKIAAASAAVIGLFTVLPNLSPSVASAMADIPVVGQLVQVVVFRDYKYEMDRNTADIEVPKIEVSKLGGNKAGQEKLERTTEEVNKEIQKITDELVKEFETHLDKEGYQDVVVKSEVLATTRDYFTLKLCCYQGAGSGYQWNYYYTIDLNTGERLQLKDIFEEGADYITPISRNIKEQMKKQMSEDKDVHYWLNDEVKELNFQAISDETSFYLDDKGNLVIGFNEGDVAPMYMGDVEFKIPAEVLEDIRK